jgi:hypothetical protein
VPAESSRSVVQGLPSSQVVGQAPGLPAAIAMSQVSSLATFPSPQLAEQSGSLAAVQPAGQQPSLVGLQATMGFDTQAALQALAEPVSAVCSQADGEGGQLVGQAPGPTAALSHASPGSTTPSPQRGAQSVSVAAVPPSGQHLSPEVAPVIDAGAQLTLQPAPTRKSLVHFIPASQPVGQLPGAGGVIPTSQVSPVSTTPSPQLWGQSGSVA